MRRFIALLALAVLAVPSPADLAEIRETIRRGSLSGTMIEALTYDDVPDDWKAQRATVETEANTVITYSRRGAKVLEVLWSKRWVDDKARWFSGALYADGARVARIMRMRDSTIVMPVESAGGVLVVTSIKDSGVHTVGLVRADGTMIDSVVLDGRATRLMDDLEYTKGMLATEAVVKPLMESINRGLGEAADTKVDGGQQEGGSD